MRRRGLLLVLWCILGASVACADVTFQTASVSEGDTGVNAAASLTFSHTVNAGPNLMLLVGCTQSCITSCPATATATFNADAMTSHTSILSSGNQVTYLFRLANPDVVTGNVVFTPSNSQRAACGALTAENVHQTVPVGTGGGEILATSSGTTLSCSVGNVPFRGAAIGIFGKNDSTEAVTVATQTEQWQDVTTSGTPSQNRHNAGAISLASGPQTFTQTTSTARALTCIAVTLRSAVDRRVPLGAYFLGGR